MKPQIIGLGYQARAGKDTVAAMLGVHGYTRISFGDQIKKVASILCNEDAFAPGFKESTTIYGMTGGQLLQNMGTGMHAIVNPTVWISMSGLHARSFTGELLVVSDVRFILEARMIRDLGGTLIKVERPGLPNDNHVSETQGRLIEWDHVINNSGTLDDLSASVDRLMQSLAERASA